MSVVHVVKFDNATIRNRVVSMYKDFVSEVDPKHILDLLIQERIISFESKEEVLSKGTKSDRCRALLDQLFYCSHDKAFIVLREALRENYIWILQRIDTGENTNEDKINPNDDNTSNHAYTLIEQKELERMKSAVEESSDSTKLTIQQLKTKLKEAKKRIKQLEIEVSRYQRYNTDLTRQLSILQSDYNEVTNRSARRSIKSENIYSNNATNINRSSEDLAIYESVEFVTAGPSIKPSTDKSADVAFDSSCLPSPPPTRSKSSFGLNFIEQDPSCLPSPPPIRSKSSFGLNFIEQVDMMETFQLKRPQLVKEIEGSAALRGMAMMDDILYVVRLGSMLVEMYDGKENFRRTKRAISLIPKDKKSKMRFLPTFTSTQRRKVPVSSGIQDIACCHRSKRLYASDWQSRRVHCLSPSKREVVCSWPVEAGDPWGISVTANGNIVVSCGSSGQLCEYTSDGNLLRTASLKEVEEGPWHALLFGPGLWIFCHGGRYDEEGFVSVSDMDGGYVDGYNKVVMKGPSHLALLPENRILVAECERNRVVMLEPSLHGPVRDILNADHGITMPVRLHYCNSSRQLIVGLHNGSVFIYAI